MFVYIIQRGALRQGSSSLLKKLADKIVEKHGEKIFRNANYHSYAADLFYCFM